MKEFLEMQALQPPTPSQSDLRSFSALQKWDAEVYGFRLPESEFHQTWESTSDGRVGKMREFEGSQSFKTIMTSTKKYASIPVPSLAIFAVPHVQEHWMIKSTDPTVRNTANEYYKRVDVMAEKQAKALEDGVPAARVIRLKGMHYIFVSNEPDVLREMRAYLGSRSSGLENRDLQAGEPRPCPKTKRPISKERSVLPDLPIKLLRKPVDKAVVGHKFAED